jgi:hypothetical protein
MLIVAIALWLILAAGVGGIADARGRSFFGWALLSLITSPVFAVIVLLLMPRSKPTPVAKRECPSCGKPIELDSEFCSHCESEVPASDLALLNDYPETHAGIRYRRERDGSVVMATGDGPKHFKNWGEFWTVLNESSNNRRPS